MNFFEKLKSKPRLLSALVLTAILILVFFVFLSCLSSSLVEWDDQFQITQNLDIKKINPHNLRKMFSTFYLGMYQPLATLSFALEYKFFHSSPLFIHLDNILLHCLNIILVYCLSRQLFNKRSVALISSALFAIHPLQVETIAWVSARSNLLSSFFCLITLITYTHYSKKRTPLSYFSSLILFAMSLMSKVATVSLSPVLLFIDYLNKRPLNKVAWLEKLPFFALSITFGLIAIRSRGINALLPPTNYSWLERLLFVPYSFIFYIKKLIMPVNLSAYYGFPEVTNGWLPPIFYLSLILFVLALIFIWRYRQNRTVVFLSAFYCLLISPTLQIKNFSTTLTADRYAYLASLAYFWFLALIMIWLFKRFTRLKIWLILSLIIFIGLTAYLAKMRTWVWFDFLSIWQDVIKNDPKVASVYSSLGNAESRQGNFDEAMKYYDQAKAIKPDDPFIYNNIGTALIKNKEDYVGAIEQFNKAISLNPNEALFYYNRANVLFKAKDLPNALIDYQNAVNLSQGDSPYYYVYIGSLAKAQYDLNLFAEAIKTYDRAIDLFALPDAYYYRGLAKIKLNDLAGGCQDLKEADKLENKEAQNNIQVYCK